MRRRQPTPDVVTSGERRQPPVLPTVRFERTAIPEDDDSAPGGGVEETKEDPDVRRVQNMIDQLTVDYERIEQEADLDADNDNDDQMMMKKMKLMLECNVNNEMWFTQGPLATGTHLLAIGQAIEQGMQIRLITLMKLMRDFGVMTTDDLFLADMDLDFGNLKYESSECQRIFALNVINTDEDGLLEYLHPLALAVKSNSKDIPNFQEALNGPDGEGFYKAMEDEMETLENKMDCWDVVPRPKDKNILPGTWAFRRKRFPDGTVKKLKARFCVRGNSQADPWSGLCLRHLCPCCGVVSCEIVVDTDCCS